MTKEEIEQKVFYLQPRLQAIHDDLTSFERFEATHNLLAEFARSVATQAYEEATQRSTPMPPALTGDVAYDHGYDMGFQAADDSWREYLRGLKASLESVPA